MALITLYIFTMPYQKLYINLLESFVLIDLAVLLMVALTDQFKVSCIIRNLQALLISALTLLGSCCFDPKDFIVYLQPYPLAHIHTHMHTYIHTYMHACI